MADEKPSTSSAPNTIDFSKLDLQDGMDDEELLRQGIENQQDLRDYLKGIEQELKEVERQTVSDCIQEGDRIADLAKEIEECDGVLEVLIFWIF